MALSVNLDQHGRTYVTLWCDGCNSVFTCYDDACYSLGELRMAATFAGWEVGQRPEHTHHCPSCVRRPDQTRP